MRMWNVDPQKMCRKHLLGEHVECHMFVGAINKGLSIKGYINNDLLEPQTLRQRHDLLVTEMIRRGYNHKSPLPEFVCSRIGAVDELNNMFELKHRCKDCFGRDYESSAAHFL